MSRMNFATLYGYMLFAEEGLVVFNPKYVERYGTAMWCLKKLGMKAEKETTSYLRESYKSSAESAKFYATYPMDLTGLTPHQLRGLRSAAKVSGGCA